MSSADSHPPTEQPNGPAARSALDWAQRTGMSGAVMAELDRLRRRRRTMSWALASGVAAMLVVGVVLWQKSSGSSPATKEQFIVRMPAHRTLEDGSVVELKEGAELDVQFTPTVRAVTLRHGTALFEVAKNPQRPFIVTAGGATVRAVGTAFSVDLTQRHVEVLVTEGRVSVTRIAPPRAETPAQVAPADSAMVGAGEFLEVLGDVPNEAAGGRELAVTPVDSEKIADKLAWRVPILDFSDTPLRRVVAMLNQHNAQKIVLGDPALADLRVSGNLRADKIQGLLEMLEQSFHVRAERHENGQIVLVNGATP